MYIKTTQKTKDWRFGLEYFNSEIGDVFYINPTAGLAMLAAGVAVRALDEEIPKETVTITQEVGSVSCFYKNLLPQLTNKETP